jgi:hypothetical protein
MRIDTERYINGTSLIDDNLFVLFSSRIGRRFVLKYHDSHSISRSVVVLRNGVGVDVHAQASAGMAEALPRR